MFSKTLLHLLPFISTPAKQNAHKRSLISPPFPPPLLLLVLGEVSVVTLFFLPAVYCEILIGRLRKKDTQRLNKTALLNTAHALITDTKHSLVNTLFSHFHKVSLSFYNQDLAKCIGWQMKYGN